MLPDDPRIPTTPVPSWTRWRNLAKPGNSNGPSKVTRVICFCFSPRDAAVLMSHVTFVGMGHLWAIVVRIFSDGMKNGSSGECRLRNRCGTSECTARGPTNRRISLSPRKVRNM